MKPRRSRWARRAPLLEPGTPTEPAEAVHQAIQQERRRPKPPPIRSIDPTTGQTRWYLDAETRQRWHDAACTLPYDSP